MISKKRVLKVALSVLIATVVGLFVGYYYLVHSWQRFLTKKELTEFVTKVKYAKDLPERFYELYEEKHPNSLSYGLNRQILGGLISLDFTHSPSLLAATISTISREDGDSTKISNRKAYILAWKLEEATTQKECLNWVMENYKFDLYIHGIHEVSNFYFRKGVAELNDGELNDVISLMKEPSIISVPDRSNEKIQ